MSKKQRKMLIRILVAAAFLAAIRILYAFWGEGDDAAVKEPVWFLLYMIPYLTVGYDILLKALKGIKNRQVFDE
ncbi:MAG: heavy metal translocating P-type ATPase, partial [Lachnospiraceae bacterium]|nr:heavy metal translocating P-type ATPase [Lachnospiraceae bacterium]